MFNFSDYPEDAIFFIFSKNKWSVKGKMKSKGRKISEAVGLKSKMYSFIVVDGG